ncbi:hypothetical protein MMYC01_209926 [Madurella mycetomatis]|uniref:Uncharacterized protein n=1 Tax=Madurella mycetomatis TaxID=100816 RepID=A0A175VP44_9PEZI|nr:hypothetical protein MMYC01_209926 [Madurella mycetomatis]
MGKRGGEMRSNRQESARWCRGTAADNGMMSMFYRLYEITKQTRIALREFGCEENGDLHVNPNRMYI